MVFLKIDGRNKKINSVSEGKRGKAKAFLGIEITTFKIWFWAAVASAMAEPCETFGGCPVFLVPEHHRR